MKTNREIIPLLLPACVFSNTIIIVSFNTYMLRRESFAANKSSWLKVFIILCLIVLQKKRHVSQDMVTP